LPCQRRAWMPARMICQHRTVGLPVESGEGKPAFCMKLDLRHVHSLLCPCSDGYPINRVEAYKGITQSIAECSTHSRSFSLGLSCYPFLDNQQCSAVVFFIWSSTLDGDRQQNLPLLISATVSHLSMISTDVREAGRPPILPTNYAKATSIIYLLSQHCLQVDRLTLVSDLPFGVRRACLGENRSWWLLSYSFNCRVFGQLFEIEWEGCRILILIRRSLRLFRTFNRYPIWMQLILHRKFIKEFFCSHLDTCSLSDTERVSLL